MATRGKRNQIEKQHEKHILMLLYAALSIQAGTKADCSKSLICGQSLDLSAQTKPLTLDSL